MQGLYNTLIQPGFALFAVCVVQLAFAIVISQSQKKAKESSPSYIFLFLMAVATCAAGYYADKIFTEAQNSERIPQIFFVNLSSEFFGALLLVPFIFGIWKNLDQSAIKLIISTIGGGLVLIIGILLIRFNGEIKLNSDTMKLDVGVVQEITQAMGIEAISNVVAALLPAFVIAGVAAFRGNDYLDRSISFFMWLLIIICAAIFIFLGTYLLNSDGVFFKQIFTGVVGATITFILLGEMIRENNWLAATVIALCMVGVFLLLLTATGISIEFSISMSGELLGAIISGITLNGLLN